MPTFDATLTAARQGGAYVEVPADVIEAIGGGKRIVVRATFDEVPYRGSVVSMGGVMALGVRKAIREQLGKRPGDTVAVTVERDDQPRPIVVPDDLAAALDAAGARSAFDALSPSHRREHVQAIEDAKRPPTRAKRVDAAVAAVISAPTGGGSSSPSSAGRRAAGPA